MEHESGSVSPDEIRRRLDAYLKDFDCEVLSDRDRQAVIEEIVSVWNGKVGSGRTDSGARRTTSRQHTKAEQELNVLRAAMHEIAMGLTAQGYVNEETVIYADNVLAALASDRRPRPEEVG